MKPFEARIRKAVRDRIKVRIVQSSSITRPEEPARIRLLSKSLGEAVNSARLRLEGRKDVPEEKNKKKGELSKCTQKCHKPVYAIITVATATVGENKV